MSPSLPAVSALMGAYNYEQYVGRAIHSFLAQDYPPELLELIVIDDGSTDSTGDVVEDLARRHPGRIRLIRQQNAGPTAATNRALSEATGEFLCLLDADDVWLPEKTRRQIEMFQARPELGLVFSDMRVVDAKEVTIRRSHAAFLGDIPERAFPRVLFGNVATQSSIMVRASLREYFDPIPADIPYADWWLTLRAAQHSKIDYVRDPLALYRIHGANLTGEVRGVAKVREALKYMSFQLWILRHLPLDTLAPSEMAYVWSGVEENACQALTAANSYFVTLTDTPSEHVARAEALMAEADERHAKGDLAGEALVILRAMAWDPYRLDARTRMGEVIAAANAAERLPHPLHGARPFVVLADAEVLLSDDDLLLDYADAMSGCESVSLAIDASRLPLEEASAELHALVDRCGLADRHDVDLVAVTGPLDRSQRYRMLKGVHAVYGAPAPDAPAGIPAYTRSMLGELVGAIRPLVGAAG